MSETATVKVESVSTKQVNGKTLWELTDGNGKVYSTFVPGIGNAALGYVNGQALIEFRETTKEKDGRTFINRYLDSIHPAPEPAKGTPEYQPEEVDWDEKERRSHRRAIWAIAVSAMQHTGSSDETPKRVYERVRPLYEAIFRDVCGEFANPPAPQDADLMAAEVTASGGLSAKDDGIPF